MSNNIVRAFSNLRPQMHSPAATECFDLLQPYFPAIPPDYAACVNLEHGYKQGGTGIVNYNMIPAEAQSVVDTLEEMGCGCLFVVPVPVSGLFSEEYLGVGIGSSGAAHRVLSQTKAGFLDPWRAIKFPPYFSVHMEGASWKGECRAQLKELLLQNLLVRKPDSALVSLDTVSAVLSKFTLSR